MKRRKGVGKYALMAAKLLGVGLLALFVGTLLAVVLYKWVPVTDTHFMRVMAKKNNCGVTQTWVPLEDISKELPLAVVSSEDNLFTKHNGFSISAIKRAWAESQKGKRVRGGSTISQQTAKNVFLWNEQSWVRKGIEVGLTFMIETIWGKRRIMEVYLNIIEQGPGIYGAEASAQTYFGHSAKTLRRDEAARMAAVLPNPIQLKLGKPSAYVLKRQGQIMNVMRKIGKVDYDRRAKEKAKAKE